MNDETVITPAETFRATMVDRLTAGGWTRSRRVAEAMGTVPRHEFVPAVSTEHAYADQAVITKRGVDGAALSCASVPSIVALMLDQLDVHPGQRILEIGAGTGYNAALLAHLSGPAGQVTTIDIDPEVTAQAGHALDATGHRDVHVITGDGALGHAGRAPYDRIILTVGAWDIPPAWWAQLAPGGRLVLPLRWRGQTRTVAFIREEDRLSSDSVELCGFVPMVGQYGEHSGNIDTDSRVALYWDADQPIDSLALCAVLDEPRTATWSGVTVGNEEPFDGIWLRLTATEPGTCRIAADRAAVDSGICSPAIPSRSPALVEGGSLAYFTLRRRQGDGAPLFELGAIGHGPAGPELADRICLEIRAWDVDRTARPVITAYPAATPDDLAVGEPTIHKHHTRLAIAF
jgi:protein-L-isoaspartate(D-aspartate) O-methyltransferase